MKINAEDLRKKIFNYLSTFDNNPDGKNNIRTKFSNICGKTGQYDIPTELFQKRTSRKNRVLISWKTIKDNKLTIKQLESFEGGVVVEFINNDYFDEKNNSNSIFFELKNRIGSDENVSSMISIRTEEGSSSSQVQRDAFQKLINNAKVFYKDKWIVLNKSNYMNYAIKRKYAASSGNSNWDGFLYVSIKGGQQDTIETHKNANELLFNPACEYASKRICLDLDFVTSYFALHSIDYNKLTSSNKFTYDSLMKILREYLKEEEFENDSYKGNLLDYCDNHPCMKLEPNKLMDPIQLEEIKIEDFSITNKEDPNDLDFTHDEAVNFNKFYWDNKQQCILSPARPTNIFWSKHLSNMMQQNYSLDEYFEHEEERVKRRKEKKLL